MFTIKDVEEMRNLMKKFKGQGNYLIQFPNNDVCCLDTKTSKLTILPDAKGFFDK